MKHFLIVVFLFTIGALVKAQDIPSFTLTKLTAQPVPVTEHKMTNLVFPVAIRAGIKVSRDVLVQKVRGVENVIELKAVRSHFAPTNLSVFGLDGRLYSFNLEYVADPPVLNFSVVPAPAANAFPSLLLSGLPVNQVTLAADAATLSEEKPFLHPSVTNEKMRLQVDGIYLKDSLLWFTGRIHNSAQVPYYPEYVHVFIQDRTNAKRTAIQQTAIEPVYAAWPHQVFGQSTETFALGYPLFVVPRHKKLWLEAAERGGGRVLVLPIGHKTILRARVVPSISN
jgi:conjugative transposon TraN protein